MVEHLGERIRFLRTRGGLSVRQLAGRAGVTAAMISYVERGKNSPSVTTLQKILSALGTDLGSFFSQGGGEQKGPMFRREEMRSIMDRERSYTMLFPKAKRIGVEMLDEQIQPGRKPEFEALRCDVAGCVISGHLTLEIDGKPRATLRPGDAFYIPKGKRHRGFAKSEPVRLVTVFHPARY